MGTPLDSGRDLAEAALVTAAAAACVIPDAWGFVSQTYVAQCDPGGIFAAGEAWLKVAGDLGDAVSAAERVNKSVAGTGWHGSDYTAYSEKVAGYIQQMIVGQVFALTVGIALVAIASLLFVRILAMLVMAAGLAVFAAAILAAMASVVGNLGASETLEADASIFAVECEIGMSDLGKAIDAVDNTLAGGIGAFLAGDIALQVAFGDTDALGDLAQASVDGIGTVCAGLTSRFYRDTLAKYMGAPRGNLLLKALGISDVVFGSSVVDRVTGNA
jgi:uncharacterized membrane protein